MKTNKKVKKYNKFLQNLIKKEAVVKIEMSFFGDNEDQKCMILDMSEDFLLLQIVNNFSLDGYAIITKYDFESIRCNKYDKKLRKILCAEGELKNKYGIEAPINIESWATILSDLQNQDFHVIIRNIRKEYLEFNIGPIIKTTRRRVKINNYNPDGKFDDKLTSINLNDIRIIQFGDRYSTIFRKYLK